MELPFLNLSISLFSLLFPVAYLSILLTSLYTFSTLYRRRKALAKHSLPPYFGPHIHRDIYFSLTNLPDHDASAAKVPPPILRAALLNRAVADIERIMQIRSAKPAVTQLVAKRVVGDEIAQQLAIAEAEMEAEVKDVVNEAKALGGDAWGNVIFQSANEMVNNRIVRTRLKAITDTVDGEKEWWARKREQSRRELEGGSAAAATTTRDDVNKTVLPGSTDRAIKTGSSDEDTVLVEPPAGTMDGGGGGVGGGGGKNKKKKGKK